MIEMFVIYIYLVNEILWRLGYDLYMCFILLLLILVEIKGREVIFDLLGNDLSLVLVI